MRRLTLRALSGAIASVAALLIWVVAVPLFDVKLDFTDPQGAVQTVVPAALILFSFGPALAGWALIAFLEWVAPKRAVLVWTVAAGAMLLLSLVPLFGVSLSAAITLGLMHLAVGAVIIWAMRSTAQPSASSAAVTTPASTASARPA